MATKKQKRAALMARREAFFEEHRRTGLEAQKKDRERRAHQEREAWREQHEKKHSYKKLIAECPLCQDIRKATGSPAPKKVKIAPQKSSRRAKTIKESI